MNNNASILRHLKKIETKNERNQIRNVDQIYLINLDKTVERLERSTREFGRYGISLERFPAIYGWDLKQNVFDEISMIFLPGAVLDSPVQFNPEVGRAPAFYAIPGKPCVHHTMAGGAIGCYLSHLSVLYDAYNAGYQTIWVLEDDVTVAEDPHRMADYLDQLDALTDRRWDLLYTDNDEHYIAATVQEHMGGIGILGRPGIPMTDALFEYRRMGSNFWKIGGRPQAHSYLIRRSGMEKILNFVTVKGIFRPYDIELAFIPALSFYNLAHDCVHGRDRTYSYTYYRNPQACQNLKDES